MRDCIKKACDAGHVPGALYYFILARVGLDKINPLNLYPNLWVQVLGTCTTQIPGTICEPACPAELLLKNCAQLCSLYLYNI